VEHVNVAGDGQIKRLATLGLIPVPQGRFISELGDGAARAGVPAAKASEMTAAQSACRMKMRRRFMG
jgi:predicted amidohydrolase YtcJ